MTISTFTQLSTSVSNWLHRADLTAVVEDFIMAGEWKINRLLRIRAMEADLSVAIASGVAALPSDYVQLKFAYISGTPTQPLQRKTAQWIGENYPTRSSSGKPLYIGRQGSNFVFGPYPDSAYTVAGVYYKRLDPLSGANETNWFTANAPDLLLYAALCEAAPYLKNDIRIAVWQAKFTEALGQVQGEADREELAGGALVASCA
jgi:hypothetical protein